MTARRVIVWIASIAFGAASLGGVLMVFHTTLDKFAMSNAGLVFLSMGALAFIWLDFLFKTKYLRS